MPLETRIRAALARGAAEDAATEAIRGFGPQILGYLTRVLGSPDDAADAFSYFSERLWKGMAGFEGRSSVRVWAYRIAWTAALRVAGDGYRRRRERLRTSMASRIAAEVVTRSAVDNRAGMDDGMDRLRSGLVPAERALLVLRLDQRLSWREVAEVLRREDEAVDEAALRKRFERLKEKLSRLARSQGLLA
jgi:RNA polymerase sigma-70 factor (ECF subfamily)